MRHRIKTKDSAREESGLLRTEQLKHKSHLLHSDKRIYFYKGKLSLSNAFRKHAFPRVASLNPVVTGFARSFSLVSFESPEKKVFTKLGQNSFYSMIKTIPLVVSSLALLMVLGGLMFPGIPSGAYAEGGDEVEVLAEGDPAIALSLADTANSGTMSGTGDEKTIQEQVKSNNVGHISVDFNVKASNIEKYDIYVQSSSKELVGEANGERIGSINTDTTYANMKNNTGWGYAVEKNSQVDPEGMTYKPIQTTVNTPVDSGSAIDTSIDQTYTLAFAANLTGATADHYKTNVILSVAAGATQVATLYSVTYNTNNSTGGITPATQTATSDSLTYTFVAPTKEQTGLEKEGYTFMGWAESPDAVFKEYSAGATITLSNSSPAKTLYAVWAKPYTLKYDAGGGSGILPKDETLWLGHLPYTYTPTVPYADFFRVGYLAAGWNSVTFTAEQPSLTTDIKWIASDSSNFNTMQDISSNGYCDALNSSGRQLADVRDGKKYWVAKLADGNCWMTQNLDLDIESGGLKAVDTDITTDWTPGTDETTITTVLNSNKWPNVASIIRSWDPALGGSPTYCNDGTVSGKCKQAGNPTKSVNDGHDAQGNYYSWGAATAGQASSIGNNGEATQSICPKGWRLPSDANSTSASKGPSYTSLVNAYSINNDGNKLLESPLYFIYGGSTRNGQITAAGEGGQYWSSTAYVGGIYDFFFASYGVSPSAHDSSGYGFSVRCVAR